MKTQNVSKIYAKAIYELGREQNIDTTQELTKISELINTSPDLENLLFLDVFTQEERWGVLNVLLEKINTSPIVKQFLQFLIEEKRMNEFPLIFKDLVVLDDHEKGFMRGVIEGLDDEISSATKERIINYLKLRVKKDIKLEYKRSENISAGYRVTIEDYQLDASLDTQLEELKKSIVTV